MQTIIVAGAFGSGVVWMISYLDKKFIAQDKKIESLADKLASKVE